MQEGITIERVINTKIVGVTRKNEDGTSRQELIAECYEGEELFLEREPDNEHDPNAISVWNEYGEQLGYINKDLASRLAPQMDKGMRVACFVTAVTGGYDDKSYGCNIKLILDPEEKDNTFINESKPNSFVYPINNKETAMDVTNTNQDTRIHVVKDSIPQQQQNTGITKKTKEKTKFSCLGCGCLVFIIIVIIAIINIIF
ncbi:HIRAN domain-containing protein [Anoxybacillus sp. J5B_2022]|uniref:HIRAN domain-containing protein n=1 Tax=Anoxybacillus sp. J5B_2022 TaxID=3003246 RepID=UPI002286902F|nr:HIRAN domain-containing protein [Anoxybacillus sp. J5B_2022]MCZ0754347.1 HIRAN domain-containing protein [Anoxybacillus sp. J5B_2022]